MRQAKFDREVRHFRCRSAIRKILRAEPLKCLLDCALPILDLHDDPLCMHVAAQVEVVDVDVEPSQTLLSELQGPPRAELVPLPQNRFEPKRCIQVRCIQKLKFNHQFELMTLCMTFPLIHSDHRFITPGLTHENLIKTNI